MGFSAVWPKHNTARRAAARGASERLQRTGCCVAAQDENQELVVWEMRDGRGAQASKRTHTMAGAAKARAGNGLLGLHSRWANIWISLTEGGLFPCSSVPR